MKKLLLAVSIVLLLASTSYARMGVTMVGGGSPASNACSSCTPGDPSDIYCEDVEGSEDPGGTMLCTSWTSTGSPVGAAHSGLSDSLGCTGKGTNAIKIPAGAVAGTARIRRDITSTAVFYDKFYAYFDFQNMNSDEQPAIYLLRDGTTQSLVIYANWKNGTTDIEIRVYYNSGAENIIMTQHWENQTWLEFSVFWDGTTADEFSVAVTDGSNSDSVSDSSAINNDSIDEVTYGPYAHGFDTAEHLDMYVDIMRTDNDTMPSDCAGTSP